MFTALEFNINITTMSLLITFPETQITKRRKAMDRQPKSPFNSNAPSESHLGTGGFLVHWEATLGFSPRGSVHLGVKTLELYRDFSKQNLTDCKSIFSCAHVKKHMSHLLLWWAPLL